MKRFFLLFLLLLNFLDIMSQNEKTTMLGKWVNYHNTNNYIVFDLDSFKIVNNNFVYSQNWTIKKSGIFLAHTEFDKKPYPYYYSIIDNFMVLLTMKPNLNQVDEIALYAKDYSENEIFTRNSKIRILINNYNPGLYMILLSHFQRYKSNKCITESREIKVNNNFIESLILMTPIDFITKNFEIYLKDKKLNLFFESELDKAKKNRAIGDEDIIVCLYGFNQIGRETINSAKNKNIVGDILMMYIGPSKDFETFPTSLDF